MVRRFFLYDAVSGVEAGNNKPSVIRYASFINLEVSLDDTRQRKIYNPVLTIQYSEVDAPSESEISNGYSEPVDQDASYTMSLDTFNEIKYGFFVFACILVGLIWALRSYNWNARNTRSLSIRGLVGVYGGNLSLRLFMELVVIAFECWNMIFFPFLIMIAWYFFTFYKVQASPLVLMPPEYDDDSGQLSPYYQFKTLIVTMFFFQLASVIVLIAKQCKVDIFFIDWEPTKGEDNKVSVWRSIMVANEWAEMQTIRKTDVRFTLFWIGTYSLSLFASLIDFLLSFY